MKDGSVVRLTNRRHCQVSQRAIIDLNPLVLQGGHTNFAACS